MIAYEKWQNLDLNGIFQSIEKKFDGFKHS